MSTSELLPTFLKLSGRRVLLVGGGALAVSKAQSLLAAGAYLTVVAPTIRPELDRDGVTLHRRPFEPQDLDDAWLCVAAAPAEVNREVAAAAETRRVFVNAVDDPQAGSAYLGGVVRRGGATIAISTDGAAPALAGLLREGLEAALPEELGAWLDVAKRIRTHWRARAVPMEQRRPLLLEALNGLYAKKRAPAPGTVSLVGAGPGDPGLLTQKGADRLRSADLVLYDALVSPELLALLPPATQRFPVGKRAGRKSIEQHTIERLMIRAAGRGKRVVRLKAGDPFVLGRGGEEALALAEAGIPFEVVPGLSSAIAGPASIGVPVTHRGLASGFLVVSGHAEETYRRVLASIAPGSVTVVVLMGVAQRAALAALLLLRGWSKDTPAAIVTAASTPSQWSWVGTLGALAATSVPEGPAGVIVVGDVVDVAGRISSKSKESHRHVHG